MNELPANLFCLLLCLLASLTLLGLAWIVARSERDVHSLPGPKDSLDVDEAYRRNVTELPEIDGSHRDQR